MREIKFRAADYDQMVYGVEGISEWEGEPMALHNWQNLMQFTGLKDKNGKEIYEGDIIDNEGARQKYEVQFHKGCFCISRGGLGYHIFNEKEVEVIGNIYENPELLA
jgi:hypothetical protein